MNARPDLKSAFLEISRVSRADGRGRVFAVASGQAEAGTSFIARQLALTAIGQGFQCALIDMGLSSNTQYEAFAAPEMQAKYGALDGPYDASFGVNPFWNVSPMLVNESGQSETQAGFMGLYIAGNTNLVMTRFMWEKLEDTHSVHIAHSRDYWHALRDRYSITFVDVPSVGKSDAGEVVFGEVDGTILVTHDVQAPENKDLLSKVSEQTGHCIGVILNSSMASSKIGDRA